MNPITELKIHHETERLLLRDYLPGDWERVHIYGSNPEFSKYEFWGPNSIEDSQNFVKGKVNQASESPRYQFDYAICLKDSGLLIGGCGIRRESENSQVANLGWAINPEFQNQGMATETARALIRFGFENLQAVVIYATCDARNVASYRVMEKIGMKRVGFIKGTNMVKGSIRDIFRYEILCNQNN